MQFVCKFACMIHTVYLSFVTFSLRNMSQKVIIKVDKFLDVANHNTTNQNCYNTLVLRHSRQQHHQAGPRPGGWRLKRPLTSVLQLCLSWCRLLLCCLAV